MPSTFRIPDAADPFGAFDAAGAWLALPAVTRDLIGALALHATFGAFVSQDAADEPHHFTEDQRAEGIEREGAAIAAMQVTIDRSLPAIFGREGALPAWAASARPDETDEAFLQRVLVEPLQRALGPDFTAPTDDRRTGREIADTAVRGLRGVLAPAFELTEADHVRG